MIFEYNGNSIAFDKGDNVMINLTDVAKAFPEKNLTQIVNSQEIKEYCESLSKLQNYSFADLLIVRKGAPHLGGGTWAHQKVALRVAQKLSPDFAVWVDTRIEELLMTGVTTITNDDEMILQAMTVLQRRLEESKQRLQMLEGQSELQQQQITALLPRATYTDEVLQSTDTYTSTQMAKELQLKTAEQLHNILKGIKIMTKQSGQWMLRAQYCGKGYTKHRTHTFTKQNGEIGTKTITVWTEQGRAFLNDTFDKWKKSVLQIL